MSASADIREMLQAMGKLTAQATAASLQTVNEVAQMAIGNAAEICPVSPTDRKNKNYTGHSGALRDSLHADPAVEKDGIITAQLGAGTDYAFFVHENLTAIHNYPGTGNPNGQAKFIEKPVRAAEKTLVEQVQKRLDALKK